MLLVLPKWFVTRIWPRLPALAEVSAESFNGYPWFAEQSTEEALRWMRHFPESPKVYLLETHGLRVVGMHVITLVSAEQAKGASHRIDMRDVLHKHFPERDEFYYVERTCVHPDHQSRGIGTKMTKTGVKVTKLWHFLRWVLSFGRLPRRTCSFVRTREDTGTLKIHQRLGYFDLETRGDISTTGQTYIFSAKIL